MSVQTYKYDNGVKKTVAPELSQLQADFALNLIRQSGSGSSIMSPVSISVALAMVYLGAKNTTAAQIRNAIANGATEAEIHKHFADVIDLVASNNLGITLEMANKVFIRQDFKLLTEYVDGIKKYYRGQLELIDFANASKSAATINNYVENATGGQIKNLISKEVINQFTQLILVNAIFFHGNWDRKFEKWKSRKDEFHVSAEKTTPKTFMSMLRYFPYHETDEYQVLGLPYEKREVFMYVILPKERYGLPNLIKSLNGSQLVEALTKCDSKAVDVKLPRFKIESNFELTNVLRNLGVIDAFGGDADFSGITGNSDLSVSKVVHKAFIETKENGTKVSLLSFLLSAFS